MDTPNKLYGDSAQSVRRLRTKCTEAPHMLYGGSVHVVRRLRSCRTRQIIRTSVYYKTLLGSENTENVGIHGILTLKVASYFLNI